MPINGKRDNFSKPSNAHDEKHFDYGGHTLLILICDRFQHTKTHIPEEQNEKDKVSNLEITNVITLSLIDWEKA